MAVRMFATLLALAATAIASPLASPAALEARTTSTCNIDQVEFQTAYGADACNLIPATITVTAPATLLAQYKGVYVYLVQKQPNWSGSSSVAVTLCKQIVHDCGGTVGVAEQYGADIPTNGAFGDATGIIEITGYNVYP